MSTAHHTYRRTARNSRARQRNRWLPYGAAGLIVIVVGGLLWLGMDRSSGGSDPGPALRGFAAPDFELQSLSGQTVSLDDYAGQVVIVNLWATWCPPCRLEMPGLNRFHTAHKDQGLVVLAVNAQEAEPQVASFIEEMGFTFQVLLDSQGQVISRYDVRSFPTTFVIDRQGVIQYVHTGAITVEQLQAVVGPLL
jgi:DsbE subfamily thiol:disulfide oxidoreductase